jgi:hypothetical protein
MKNTPGAAVLDELPRDVAGVSGALLRVAERMCADGRSGVAGVDAKQRICGAAADEARRQGDEADPAPRRLVAGHESEGEDDEDKACDHAGCPIKNSNIRFHREDLG